MIHNRQEYIENLINNVSTHTPWAKKESMLIDNNPLLRVLAHNILDDWDKDYSKVLKKIKGGGNKKDVMIYK